MAADIGLIFLASGSGQAKWFLAYHACLSYLRLLIELVMDLNIMAQQSIR